jgi:D-alanyl-D-alanine carboxypeptidase/D-alanyl-D-alanine-endopeptidase (penicillin-binding protein 4)
VGPDLSRRFTAGILAALTLLAAAPASQAASLKTRLGRALDSSGIPATGAFVVNLSSGNVVFSRQADVALKPASNEKLAVALATLAELGAGYRIPTRVYGEGHQDGKVWRGRLVLKGYGDPTLARDDLHRLAREVRSRGIRLVTGGIVADESFFDAKRTAPGWKPSYYKLECPPLTALIVGRGEVGGHTVTGPALMTGRAFRKVLEEEGVRVTHGVVKGIVKPTASPLAHVASPMMSVVVRRMNLESDNFYAEMLLKELGALIGTKGSTAAGAKVVRGVLKDHGVPLAGVRVVDGSGLSNLDRWTARGIGVLLRSALADTRFSGAFFRSLPVAGRSGTLKDRMKQPPALARVRAKTGTTSEASALSGYVRQRFLFAILQNGSPVPTSSARKSQDRFAQILAGAASG